MEFGTVDDLHGRLKNRFSLIQAPSNTFYGMREFILRNLNGFWITFGQPIRT